MKLPKYPTKPYCPTLPRPPDKQIENRISIGSLTSQEYSEFSLDSIKEYIMTTFADVNPANVKFSMEINTHHGYYDEISTSLDINFFHVSLVDNPHYEKLYKDYEKRMEKYKSDYQQYRKDSDQYKVDMKNYKKELDKYNLEYAKKSVKRLEAKKGNKK